MMRRNGEENSFNQKKRRKETKIREKADTGQKRGTTGPRGSGEGGDSIDERGPITFEGVMPRNRSFRGVEKKKKAFVIEGGARQDGKPKRGGNQYSRKKRGNQRAKYTTCSPSDASKQIKFQTLKPPDKETYFSERSQNGGRKSKSRRYANKRG